MFEISTDTLQKIANYLATKPFMEVAPLIQLIQQLKPVPSPEVAKPELVTTEP